MPLTVAVGGSEYEVTDELVSVVERVPDGVSRVSFDGGTVYVDEALSGELRRRGLAHDVPRRAQETRAELDLAVDRRVRLSVVTADEEVRAAVAEHAEQLRADVRVTELTVVASDDGGDTDNLGADDGRHSRDWTVEGSRVTLRMVPAAASAGGPR